MKRIRRERVRIIESFLESLLDDYPHEHPNAPYNYIARHEKGQYRIEVKVFKKYDIQDYDTDGIL